MPFRKIVLAKDQIYHVFNRSVAQQPILNNKRENGIFLESMEYYRFSKPPFRFSHYSRLNIAIKPSILQRLYAENNVLVEIYAFCLMPNHYHILLKQITDNGISNFIRLLQNSYARFLNIKTKRFGSLFQSPFKAVRIETDEQFLHVSRYIHLNPLTSYILKDPYQLPTYVWSSWRDFLLENPRPYIKREKLLGIIKKEKLIEFTFNQLDYQRNLQNIKHLILE